MPREEVDVLVLGAGIAGLAARFALTGVRDVVCLEAAEEIGGLLRMFRHGDFSFDSTVHALPSRAAIAGRLVAELAGPDLRHFRKQNLVWQQGRVIEYPYQFHAHALPLEIREECIAALPAGPASAALRDGATFEEWLLAQFGKGFYRHFFGPYNRKLYGVDPSRLEAAPMTWTIPADNREAVLRGAAGPSPDEPAVECTYPAGREGISRLASALAERGRGDIRLAERAVRIDLDARTVATDRGRTLSYESVVSTLPLPTLLALATGLPDEVARWATLFSASQVTIVRIAIERSGDGLPAQWTYFPDPEVPFYRLTRLERISPDLAPPGASAVLLEIAGDAVPDDDVLLDLCRRLAVAGPGKASCAGRLVIPHAYVLFERGHRAASVRVVEDLKARGVHVAGRYGCWGYSNIDQTIESGLQAAREILHAGERGA